MNSSGIREGKERGNMTIWKWTTLVSVVAGTIWTTNAWSGDLTPPGAPAPTMHTLEEIHNVSSAGINTQIVHFAVLENSLSNIMQTVRTAHGFLPSVVASATEPLYQEGMPAETYCNVHYISASNQAPVTATLHDAQGSVIDSGSMTEAATGIYAAQFHIQGSDPWSLPDRPWSVSCQSPSDHGSGVVMFTGRNLQYATVDMLKDNLARLEHNLQLLDDLSAQVNDISNRVDGIWHVVTNNNAMLIELLAR